MQMWSSLRDPSEGYLFREIDKARLSASLIGSVKLLSPSTPQRVSADNMGCVFTLSFNHQGTVLAGATADSSIVLWDYYSETQNPFAVLSHHTEVVTCVQWMHHSDNTFFSSSIDKSIVLWKDLHPVEVLRDHQDWIRCLSLSSSDRTMLSGCVASQVCVWDIETKKVVSKIDNAILSDTVLRLVWLMFT